jgi:hypothetical protein
MAVTVFIDKKLNILKTYFLNIFSNNFFLKKYFVQKIMDKIIEAIKACSIIIQNNISSNVFVI